jgi:FkbM family methyltransferase
MGKLSALKCTVAYNKYGGYCVPTSSIYRPAANKVLRGDVYEPDTIEFMRAHCQDRDIVHAGTFFGDFLPALSTAIGPSAMVWAFEPNHESYRCAQITLVLNEISNVRLTHAALGAQSQRLFLETTDKDGRSHGGASRIVDGSVPDGGKKESVNVVAIDDVVGPDRNVGILQLDVEGYEKEALIGAMGTVRRCLPIIIVEVLPESGWFAQNILSLGYRESAQLHGNSVFVCEAAACGGG